MTRSSTQLPQFPNPSRSGLRDRERLPEKDREARRGNVEADEVDNGLIGGSQEISRGSFVDADGAESLRVRFESGRAQPAGNGVRREDGSGVIGVPRTLTKRRGERGSPKPGHVLPEIRVNGVNVEEQESTQRLTNGARVGENGERERGDARTVGDKLTDVDIVQRLVESR